MRKPLRSKSSSAGRPAVVLFCGYTHSGHVLGGLDDEPDSLVFRQIFPDFGHEGLAGVLPPGLPVRV